MKDLTQRMLNKVIPGISPELLHEESEDYANTHDDYQALEQTDLSSVSISRMNKNISTLRNTKENHGHMVRNSCPTWGSTNPQLIVTWSEIPGPKPDMTA